MNADEIIDVVERLDPLADLPRTGWLLRGVRPCESIAEHSHGVALVALMLADSLRDEGQPVDVERVLRLALLHDAAEAATGDIPMPQKTEALADALMQVERRIVSQLLPERLAGDWEEAERGESLEARVVKAADKIHMMIKALRYGRQGRGTLEEFWSNPANFDDRGLPPARAVFEAICARAGRVNPRAAGG